MPPHRNGSAFELEAVIPAGTRARIVLPRLAGTASVLAEGGAALSSPLPPGIEEVGETDDSFIVSAGPGRYSFTVGGP